ncbi:ribonuclease HII [Brevirhabdus sp.]|uniref:ribonuclease HII n=1 Tax=Brevirhabdus sp. TaxID=2004514 RepID=UPI0040584B63
MPPDPFAPTGPDYSYERAAALGGARRIVGVDEVGRGPIAGPVVAAAVWLDPERIPGGLNDSKKLTARRREALLEELLAVAVVSVAQASVAEIEQINILRASHLAMQRAVEGLPFEPDFQLIDGRDLPRQLSCPARPVIKGDALCVSIAAASIAAKVTRDRLMVGLSQQHSGYGWETNAGYPTKSHILALNELGVTPHHRNTFAPVHNILCKTVS